MVRLGGKKYVRFKDQHYGELKKRQLTQGTSFDDVTFPPIDSIFGTSTVPTNVVWKRPREIAENPRVFENVETPSAIHPGELSCPWFVSAMSVLTGLNELRNKVIPDYWEQEWNEQTYCGIFHFRFWRFGNWVDVVVDDLLPTANDVLLTSQSSSKNEFWIPLLEKAYAKLHGSYATLREGHLCDALVDFTGGVCEILDLAAGRYAEIEDKRSQLFDLLAKESNDHSIICFSVSEQLRGEGERTELGLMRGHSYHLTDVKKAYLGETTLRNLFNGREKVAMVRFQDFRSEEKKPPASPDSALGEGNPFVYDTNALSRLRSRNTEWQHIKEGERQRIGLHFRGPREFWMPLEDVVHEFSEITICRLVTENIFVASNRKWKGSSTAGKWTVGPRDSCTDRSGGGDPSQESFLHNPQYIFGIAEDAEVIFQLLQYVENDDSMPPSPVNFLLGFHIIKVEENRETRLHKLWDHTPIVINEDHRRCREIMYRGTMTRGRYIILPTLYRPGDACSFLIRALCQTSQLQLKELMAHEPSSMNPCLCLMPSVEWVTVLVVENADLQNDAQQAWIKHKGNPFCTISCEGVTVKTEVAQDDVNPEWRSAFVFFRKKTEKPIVIKVLNKNVLMPNELIGECQLPAPITHSPTPLDAPLSRKSKASDENSSVLSVGTLHITFLTEDNLMAI